VSQPKLRQVLAATLFAALGVAVVAALGGTPAAAASEPTLAAQFAPPQHADPRDAATGPLDVRSVAFGQAGALLTLRIRTEGRWDARELAAPGRSLCVVLTRSTPARVVGRLCVVPRRRATVLLHQRVDAAGRPGAWRRVEAAVARPGPRSVEARFAPSAIGLALGSVGWWAEARGRGGAGCAAACEDRVPESGSFSTTVGALGHPPCFAAAARDPLRACSNPLLRRVVLPRPADAVLMPNAPCRIARGGRRRGVLRRCEFGVTTARRRGTFALIGDSHAATWRGALEVVAQAQRLRGVSITRPGCPFSTHVPASPDLGPAGCVRLHAATLAWLRANRYVDTVFLSTWAQPASGPMGGTAAYGGGTAAFGALLDAIPRSVRHIYVLRDNPGTSPGAPSCVEAARTRRRPLAGVCAPARSAVLVPDPLAAAARARGPRARVIDLTRFFCGPRRCPPVIGGAYVYKDDNHMNSAYATSLGPFVLRALERDQP